MTGSDTLLERAKAALADQNFGVDDLKLFSDMVNRIEGLQATNLRLAGMCYDLTAERDRLQAKVRFLERKAVESAKKA